jgi:S-DNA-T family DNA segregation ATPase FtsK/SpoIIIE
VSQSLSFNRMPRVLKALPEQEVQIPQPPATRAPPKANWFLLALPFALMLVTVGVRVATAASRASNNAAMWMTLSFTLMSIGSGITSLVNTISQRKAYKAERERQEQEYAQVLVAKEKRLADLRHEQRQILRTADPGFDILLRMAQEHDPHLWERRLSDPDFLCVRVGMGRAVSSVAVKAPHPPMPDPRLQEAHRIEAEYQFVPDVPLTADLKVGPLGIAGPEATRVGVARSLVCNLATHHSPDEVYILAIFDPSREQDWRWLRWLPHTYVLDPDIHVRYLANDPVSAKNLLDDLLEALHQRENVLESRDRTRESPSWPWMVVLVDQYAFAHDNPAINLLLTAGTQLNATGIFLVDQDRDIPMGCNNVAMVLGTGELECSVAGVGGHTFRAQLETVDSDLAEELARGLAPLQVHSLRSDSDMPSEVKLLDAFNLIPITKFDPRRHWSKDLGDRYLKVVIGERRGGQPMILDLSHTGHGPHGLVAGTTGSGKSVLLQTLVLSIALTHHPYQVGFVLVDFKGGGTFTDLVPLPHTLGLVTDLGGNMTTRALVALNSEMDRRKRLFLEAEVNDIRPYQEKHERGELGELPPLPRLVVIIDEFAELVSDYPDFIDGLIGIARVGRSLGVHLILATQSPAGVVKQQIWANARFRICLRVESRQESQEMLHRGDAANLPRLPGRGYFQVGNNEIFELFQSAHVVGKYRDDQEALAVRAQQEYRISRLLLTGQREVLFDSAEEASQRAEDVKAPTDLEVIVDTLVSAAEQLGIEKLPSPWPEQLPKPEELSLDDVWAQLGYGGWNGHGWTFAQNCSKCHKQLQGSQRFCPKCGEPAKALTPASPGYKPSLQDRPWLYATLGLVDNPVQQVQEPFVLPLTNQDGNLIVVGAQGSGKTMLLRSLVLGLARAHTPQELNLYAIEFGGQALRVLERLPHMGNVLTPADMEQIQRLLLFLQDRLGERKTLCNQAGVNDLVALRERQPLKAPPAIVLVVTGFAEFRNELQDQILQLIRIIREGGPYGIHVVLVGDRAGDMPSAVSSIIARRIVLRLADAEEYGLVLGTRLRLSNEQAFPLGRGWYGRPPLEFQTASPISVEQGNDPIVELQGIADAMRQAWQGPCAEQIGVLGSNISFDQIVAPAESGAPPGPPWAVPVGLDGVRLRPAHLDLVEDGPNFVVSSTPKGGKTTLLQTWLLSLARSNSPQQMQFVLVAGRRNSLRPLETLPHVLDYCRMPDQFKDGVLERLLAETERRDSLLADGSGGESSLSHIVLAIDDYDEFYSQVGSDSGLQDGLDKLAKRGRYVNMHIAIAVPLSFKKDYSDKLFDPIKNGRSGFALRILDAASVQSLLGLRLRDADIGQMPPGRGFVVRNGTEELLQVAAFDAKHVNTVQQQWQRAGVAPASWPKRD